MITRDHDGTTPLGWRWWRLSREEKDRFAKQFPREWRIDWDYIYRNEHAVPSKLTLLTAGQFHRMIADQEFELCRAARDG